MKNVLEPKEALAMAKTYKAPFLFASHEHLRKKLNIALEVLNYPNRRLPMETINGIGKLDDTLAFIEEWIALTRKALVEIETGSQPAEKK